ncbi:hypothetical protein V6N13_007909 [Hibiscus sabdariffa]
MVNVENDLARLGIYSGDRDVLQADPNERVLDLSHEDYVVGPFLTWSSLGENCNHPFFSIVSKEFHNGDKDGLPINNPFHGLVHAIGCLHYRFNGSQVFFHPLELHFTAIEKGNFVGTFIEYDALAISHWGVKRGNMESLNRSMDISRSNAECSDILLHIRETHFLEL